MREKRQTARIFRNGKNEAVRIPREFSFGQDEVFVTRRGDEVIFSARPRDLSALLEGDAVASNEFLRGPAWGTR